TATSSAPATRRRSSPPGARRSRPRPPPDLRKRDPVLRLHHAPLACSLASRLALMEAGRDHEIVLVRTGRGEQKAEAYLRINPRGQVPALETPDGVLTESVAILPYIADLAPEAGLMPPGGTFQRAQAMAWLSHLSSTVHAAYGGLLK